MNEDQSTSESCNDIKLQINKILENLTDEQDVQPIVYELFEQCDPEDVKKTIEHVQRALEFKNEEVKKHLSKNHEHLFSCTDLLEQLKEFVLVSKKNLKKMEEMNKAIEEVHEIESESEVEKCTYQVDSKTFLQEVVYGVENILEEKPLLAGEGLLSVIEEFGRCNQNDLTIKALWSSMLTRVAHRINSSLVNGIHLDQNFILVFTLLLELVFEKNHTCKVQFSRIQAVSIVSKQFHVQPNISFSRESKTEDFLYQLLEAFLSTSRKLDIIEVLKLVQILDHRQSLELDSNPSKNHSILSEIYNMRIHLIKPNQYQHWGTSIFIPEASANVVYV